MQDKLIKTLKDEILYEMAAESEPIQFPAAIEEDIFKSAIEAVIKEKPEWKKMNLMQLKDNDEFQKIFKAYLSRNQSGTIEVLKSVIPKRHVKPNNKLTNKMTKNIVDEGEFDLVVSGKKAKKEVCTKVIGFLNRDAFDLSCGLE